MSPDFKHRELVTEAIIGSGANKGTLSFVYNALNGFSPEIDFKVGDLVISAETEYMYKTEESRTTRNSKSEELGKCKVVDIDLYAEKKIQVEYDFYKSDDTIVPQTKWIKHTNANKIPTA